MVDTNADIVTRIDALLDLNAKGKLSHRVPGLAVELLEQAAAGLRKSPSSSEVRVKPLEWEAVEPNWWVAQPPVMIGGSGYEVRITDSGKVRARRGSEDWFQFDGTADEAKAHWQADYEQRIRSALSPTVSQPVTGEEVEWKTEASGLEVATIQHDDFSLLEVCKSRSPSHAFHLTIHRGSEDKGAWDDLSIDLTEGEARKLREVLTAITGGENER